MIALPNVASPVVRAVKARMGRKKKEKTSVEAAIVAAAEETTTIIRDVGLPVKNVVVVRMISEASLRHLLPEAAEIIKVRASVHQRRVAERNVRVEVVAAEIKTQRRHSENIDNDFIS